MRTTATFSILFWIYSKRVKNNQAPLFARITANGKQLNFSLKRKVELSRWDSGKQCVRGTGAKAKEINLYLDQEYSRLVQIYQEIRYQGKAITPENIKARYFKEDQKLFSFEDLFNYHNDNMFSKLRNNTSRMYLTSQKYLRLFIQKEYKRKNFYLRDLDYSFILRFENYLRSVKPRHYRKKLQHNAVMKHIQRLRKMVTMAFHLEWIERDPFVKFKSHLEIPLELEYFLVDKQVGISLIAGASTFFLQENEVTLNSANFNGSLGPANNLNQVSFSANLGIGFRYRLFSQFEFDLNPIFKYQLNTYEDVINLKPYHFGIYSGLRFEF